MENINIDSEALLKDQRVIDEIQRHLWIESEKAGRDIGFEEAKEDWLKKFSKAWMAYNMPEALKNQRKSEAASPKAKEASQPKEAFKAKEISALKATQALEPPSAKKRRAKSYL